jgi:HSP20 family protein
MGKNKNKNLNQTKNTIMFNKQETTNREQQFEGRHRGCGHFGRKFGSMFGSAMENKAQWRNALGARFGNRKAANIEETDSAFILSLYAAGLRKSDFTILVKGDVLTIKYTAPATTENNQNQYAHLEYEPSSFERSFQLNGKVITENISASYVDGVLKVTLPKNPETNKPAQQVQVD